MSIDDDVSRLLLDGDADGMELAGAATPEGGWWLSLWFIFLHLWNIDPKLNLPVDGKKKEQISADSPILMRIFHFRMEREMVKKIEQQPHSTCKRKKLFILYMLVQLHTYFTA